MKRIHNDGKQIPNVDSYARVSNLIFGVVLIASVFMVEGGVLGWLTLMPIAAVYPIFVAITGYSPHRAIGSAMMHYFKKINGGHGAPDDYYRLVMH